MELKACSPLPVRDIFLNVESFMELKGTVHSYHRCLSFST
ncbi:hypothetical protein Mcup_1084 [Metallosphaera cuprina Ar-4]|uniref:Uncharacterized protein n=1 Tax=Metallosphaera cuprina (strain Ar-4) TaxID=1006006 RepID=F4G2Z1_METCR|nr:hypothetical protein Mcup_1084 [Metallosphaera cuprina Ar-4]